MPLTPDESAAYGGESREQNAVGKRQDVGFNGRWRNAIPSDDASLLYTPGLA